jgi:PAS domain S-box-containing protein
VSDRPQRFSEAPQSNFNDLNGTCAMPASPAHSIAADKAAANAEALHKGALLKATALQSAILNSANFSIIATDEKGIIQLFNIGAERMLGYTAAELVNRLTPTHISDPLDVMARAVILSREFATSLAPGFEALVFKAARDLEDIYEMTYIRKDGSRFPAIVSVSALRDADSTIIGYLLVTTDNSMRKQVEEKLQWTDECFRLMVESVTDHAIAMLDPEGRVVSWNAGAQRIRGYSAEEIVGQHFSRLYPPEEIDRGTPQENLEAVTTDGRLETEGWRVRKDGSRFWANVIFTAIRDPAGNLRGFANVIRDMTEPRQIEAEIANAHALAEKASRANADFLSGMSHELRTTLNAILGFAQLMESGSPLPTPLQKENIAKILQAGWYLLELINEILDLATIESGRLSWSLEPMSLADVMLECQNTIEPQAQKSGIRMSFPQVDRQCFIKADRTRVKQVLINLLSNAIKYNQVGGSVVVECGESAPQRLRVSVTDTGVGLSPEQLEHLFRPFSRVGQETSAGAGIGLVVTKRLIELMGGAIGVESTVGEGSVFWIELVVASAPQLAADDAEHIASVQPYALESAAPRTLLYVEDNPANLQLVEQIIARRPDMRLLSARTGTAGIELARSSRPDVILMDINLPGMSGIKAMQILRADTATAQIPIVALSANALPRDIERGLEAGFFRYLTKPIKVSEFMDALDVALKFAAQEVGEKQ